MAVDNTVSIQLAGAVEILNPTPSDPRKRVDSLSAIANSPVYFVGFDNIYVADEDKHYNVTSGDAVNGWVFEEFSGGSAEAGNGQTTDSNGKLGAGGFVDEDIIYFGDNTIPAYEGEDFTNSNFIIRTGKHFLVGTRNFVEDDGGNPQTNIVFGQENTSNNSNQIFINGWENIIESGSHLSSINGMRCNVDGSYNKVFGYGANVKGKLNFANINNQIPIIGTLKQQSVESEHCFMSTRGTTAGREDVFMGIADGSDFSAILGGTNNGVQANHPYSIILGGTGIISDEANTTYVDKLKILGDKIRIDQALTSLSNSTGKYLYRDSDGIIKEDDLIQSTAKTPTSIGEIGQKSYNGGFMYTCVATDTWVRQAVDTSW